MAGRDRREQEETMMETFIEIERAFWLFVGVIGCLFVAVQIIQFWGDRRGR